MPVLSVDPIESALLRSGIERSFETGLAAYVVAEACADRFLAAGLSTIIDAVSSVDVARESWRALAQKHGVPLSVIVCELDRSTTLTRLAGRTRGLALSEPTGADLDARAAEWLAWPEEHLVLDSRQSATENLARALAFVRAI